MFRLLVLVAVSLIPTIAFAGGTLTIQTNEEVTLTKCAEEWSYEFDCVALNDDVRCVQPPGTDPSSFKGFPSCTAAGMPQTGTEFVGQEPGRVYVVKAGENEARFVGIATPGKPRIFNIGELKITITVK